MSALSAVGVSSIEIIKPEMISPVTETLTKSMGVILPIGLTLFGTIFSIKFIPQLFRKFTNN